MTYADAAEAAAAEVIRSDAYTWISLRFGENAACALMPDAWFDQMSDETLRQAREHFATWLAVAARSKY